MDINEVNKTDIELKPFEPKNELNKDFFDKEGNLKPYIRMHLLDIADDFIDELEMKWVKPKDIVITGSLANYNWSKYSDVDIHIIYNFKSIYKNVEFVKDYFDSKRNLWNKAHEELSINGYPVEISVEDTNSPAQSTGVYSLEKNKWVKEPQDMSDAELNKDYIKSFCAKNMTKLDDLFDRIDKENDKVKLQRLGDKLVKLYDRLHDMRKEGLATKAKEMSTGNIIWKVIKHAGYADKIWKYKDKVYDEVNTLNEGKTIVLSESQVDKIKSINENK